MEERAKKRIQKKLAVTVENYKGYILDMSPRGMKIMLSTLLKQRRISVYIHLPGGTLPVQANVCWIRKQLTVYRQAQYKIGLFIPNPPAAYTRLVAGMMKAPA